MPQRLVSQLLGLSCSEWNELGLGNIQMTCEVYHGEKIWDPKSLLMAGHFLKQYLCLDDKSSLNG